MKENESTLKTKMLKYEKLKNSDMIQEEFGIKPYLQNLTVHSARTIFKKRSSMTRYVKMNYMSDARNIRLPGSATAVSLVWIAWGTCYVALATPNSGLTRTWIVMLTLLNTSMMCS